MSDKTLSECINGKALAAEILAIVAQKISSLKALGQRPPGLSVILVGQHEASCLYVRNKLLACTKTGIVPISCLLPHDCSLQTILDQISALNQRNDVDGILVQLPLPAHINVYEVMTAISPEKDVDGFHPLNIGKLQLQQPTFVPCTPAGIMHMLSHLQIPLMGSHAVMVGASAIVGRPLSTLLSHAGSTVTLCQIHTRDLSHHTQQADIVISATGVAHLIQKDMVAPGSTLIDVGINHLPDGRLVGDIDFESCWGHVRWITPVPGGVGPLTIAKLLENVLISYQRKE